MCIRDSTVFRALEELGAGTGRAVYVGDSDVDIQTAAILGAGSAGGGTVNHRVAARIALTWLFTFPGCGLLGFLLASLFRSPLSCGILMPGTIF